MVNFITLSKELNDPTYLVRATRLVHTVHNVLGRTRDGKVWLPGASHSNPIGGGLRIGKIDEAGSDGDGQYHHYLTLWMFALNRSTKTTGDRRYNDQAIALARAIHPSFFLDRKTSEPRMVWKMSMNRQQPLVRSQGNLDPISGYLIFRLLQASSDDKYTLMSREIADYEQVIGLKGKHFISSDTLDLGMTLLTSHWLIETVPYFKDLQQQAQIYLHRLFEQDYLDLPIGDRLAFREYGTCLGTGCVEVIDNVLQQFRDGLMETCEKHRRDTPGDLRAISEVMRAAALIPGALRTGSLGPEGEI